uniref:Apple domain-containing protein n=1 Tax=Tetranychus urticae TaxID=32264 RepID=T1L1J9_TETUR
MEIGTQQLYNGDKVLNEFHADETYQVLRQTEQEPGYKEEKLYDYSLGVQYSISGYGVCYTFPINSDAPGMDESGSFSIASLLWLSNSLKYLGQIIFEHRSGYNVHVWESTEINRVMSGKTYDKVVTTQYLSSSYQNDLFNGYSLVAASMKLYRKNEKHRDYYDSNSDLPEYEYHEALQVEDCFKKPEERLNLKFYLTCKDSDGCIQKSQDSVYEMKELFRSSLLGQLGISTTRVADIDFKFQKEVIEADVTFLEAPKISEVLPSETKTLEPQFIKKLHETVTSSEEKCLRYHASFVPHGAAIVYCADGNVCFSTTNEKDVKESEAGAFCSVYTDPYKKLNRLGREKPLSDLHDHILGYLGHITFNMNLDEKAKAVAFQVTDVVAQSEDAEERKQPFDILYHDSQFDKLDGVNTVMIPGVDRFGDCYRACSQNKDIPCETFSFCNRKDKKECVVSIWSEPQIKNNLASDSGKKCSFGGYVTSANTEFYEDCDIYILKSSEKYSVTGTKLVSQVLYTEVDLDLDQCAALCDDDQSCKSFNFCPKGKASSRCQITSYSIGDPKTQSVDSSICHNFELNVKSKAEELSDNTLKSKVSGFSGGGVGGITMLFLFIGLFSGFVGSYVYTKVKSGEMNKFKDNFGWSKQEDDDENQTQF